MKTKDTNSKAITGKDILHAIWRLEKANEAVQQEIEALRAMRKSLEDASTRRGPDLTLREWWYAQERDEQWQDDITYRELYNPGRQS